MRIAALAVVLVLVPRVGAADLDSQRVEVRRCLEATAAAASSEDLNAYIECFDARLRPLIRLPVGAHAEACGRPLEDSYREDSVVAGVHRGRQPVPLWRVLCLYSVEKVVV
jgi:hypothetical protein